MKGWTTARAWIGRRPDSAATISIEDLRRQARRRLPRAVFEFIDGAAEDEFSLRANRRQFEDVQFRQRILIGTRKREQSVELFGRRFAAPFGIGPTGLAGMAWPGAELALARAAAAAGVPFTLGTFACARIEDIAAATQGPKWFQLYILRDRGLSRALAERALAAGYEALVVTADCPVSGKRERDPRNDFSIPLRLTPRNTVDVLRRPGWLTKTLRAGLPLPLNLIDARRGRSDAQTLSAFAAEQLDSSVTWNDIADVRRFWPGPLVVKGVLTAEDARRTLAVGGNGIVVSNHGGRQLDTAVSPLSVLQEIADAVEGQLAILCDSGFRRGGDVVKAIALGADFVLLGRATLYGVAAAGEAGAVRALEIIREEVDRVLALLGCASIQDVTSEHVRVRSYLGQDERLDVRPL